MYVLCPISSNMGDEIDFKAYNKDQDTLSIPKFTFYKVLTYFNLSFILFDSFFLCEPHQTIHSLRLTSEMRYPRDVPTMGSLFSQSTVSETARVLNLLPHCFNIWHAFRQRCVSPTQRFFTRRSSVSQTEKTTSCVISYA